jgi:hypothetical protein
MHGTDAEESAKRPKDSLTTDPSSTRKRGAQPANTNTVQHGAYSPRLLPEEEETYRSKKAVFAQALGGMDAFDQQLVHLLAMLAAKVDTAAAEGANPDAIGPLINQIIQLMRELKATRASRPPEPQGAGKTLADLFVLLQEMIAARRQAKGVETDKAEGPVERNCIQCGCTAAHTENVDGGLVCSNCGKVTEETGRQPTAGSGNDEEKST